MEFRLEDNHPLFRRLVPTLETLATGFTFTEGPVWRGDNLVFSDIPNNRTVQYRPLPEGPEVTTLRHPTGAANGMTVDLQGDLIVCEQSTRQLIRLDSAGQVQVLANSYEGKRLNSPNDVVVRSDGVIFFTDPPYGLRGFTEVKEVSFLGVYRIDLDGSLHLVVDDMDKPNGLAFSPDEKTLYVDDSGYFHIRAFDVSPDGSLSNSRVFAEVKPKSDDERGVADGMKVNADGFVFCTGPGGVWIFNDGGRLMGRIVMPEVTANLAWGDADWKTLYLTASTTLYRLRLNVPGIAVGPRRA